MTILVIGLALAGALATTLVVYSASDVSECTFVLGDSLWTLLGLQCPF